MKLEFTTHDQDEIIAQYLVAEFEALNQRALQYEQNIGNKTNFFLAIVTATIGGIVVIGTQNSMLTPLFLPATCIVLAFLLTMGLTTFLQILDLLAQSIYMYRKAGRIRRWFLDFPPKLAAYIPFTVTDQAPPYYVEHMRLRGIEAILMLVNSAIAGVFSGTLLMVFYIWTRPPIYFLYAWMPYAFATGFGFICFAIVWRQQVKHMRSFLKNQETQEIRDGRIHFPFNRRFDMET